MDTNDYITKPQRELRQYLMHPLSWIILATLISGFLTCSGYLLHGTLYWDNGRLFTQFRDNLHSLNYFGEIAWWFPQSQFGSPGYFHSLLGVPSCGNPLFVLIGLSVWLLGKCGIYIQHYHTLYVIYFGFLTPFLFLSGLWLFASQLFKKKTTLYLILLMGAFSPGVLLNISDIGFLESCAYSLFFGAAFLKFLRKPEKESFFVFFLSTLLLAMATNNGLNYWAIFAVPMFVLIATFSPWERGIQQFKRAFFSVPKSYWVLYFVLVAVCVALPFVILGQGEGYVRSKMGTRFYAFERLYTGNPLEMILSSLPSVGFFWHQDPKTWVPTFHSTLGQYGWYYLGLLSFPLALFGLLKTKTSIRRILWIWFALLFGIICLSAYSPIFAPFFLLLKPLRGINHFSDMTFRAGGFLVILFAAAYGFDNLCRRKATSGKLLFKFFAFYALIAHLIYFYAMEQLDVRTGLLFAFTVFYAFVLYYWVTAKSKRHRRHATYLLLAAITLDITTQCFMYVRRTWKNEIKIGGWPVYVGFNEKLNPDRIGMQIGGADFFYTNGLLMYEPYKEMRLNEFEVYKLPEYGLYARAHTNSDMKSELDLIKENDYQKMNSLVLPAGAFAYREFRPFFSDDPKVPPPKITGRITILKKTYNQRVVQVESSADALFFMRDGYSPYWNARLNGKETAITRALYNFKAVRIPKGKSVLHFEFKPPWIAFLLTLNYTIFLGVSLVCLLLFVGRRSETLQEYLSQLKEWKEERLKEAEVPA